MTTLPTEPKGERTVLVQNTDGTTSWVNPQILGGIHVSNESPEGWYSSASGRWEWHTGGSISSKAKASVQKGEDTDMLVNLRDGGTIEVKCDGENLDIRTSMNSPIAVMACNAVNPNNVQAQKPWDIFYPIYFTVIGIIIFIFIMHILRNHRSH